MSPPSMYRRRDEWEHINALLLRPSSISLCGCVSSVSSISLCGCGLSSSQHHTSIPLCLWLCDQSTPNPSAFACAISQHHVDTPWTSPPSHVMCSLLRECPTCWKRWPIAVSTRLFVFLNLLHSLLDYYHEQVRTSILRPGPTWTNSCCVYKRLRNYCIPGYSWLNAPKSRQILLYFSVCLAYV